MYSSTRVRLKDLLGFSNPLAPSLFPREIKSIGWHIHTMRFAKVIVASLVIPMMILSAWAITAPSGGVEPLSGSIMAEPPDYVSGYGFDAVTQTMEDTNGFRYSYQDDGIIQLDLPWGYTTHFSFGLTADYLGSPEKRTALDYTWAWDTTIGVALNETGNLTGYTYTFVATNQDGVLGWDIRLDFSPTSRMKVTHTLENGYAQSLTDVNFWYLWDLRGTATPYLIETSAGTVEGPLYQAIPDDIHWVRLANQFQFDWRDALVDYENGHAYIGDGSVVGLGGVPILGISLELGDMTPGATVTIDPFFSGLEKTWDAAGDASASSPASWSPVGALAAGDNVTFDATSVTNCDWNVGIVLGNFSMLTGYSGVVTQSVDFGCVDFTLVQGTFTGSTSYTKTVYGNWSYPSGLISFNVLNLEMAGDGYTVTSNGGGVLLYTLTISNNTTMTSAVLSNNNDITIETGITLTITNANDRIIMDTFGGGVWTNNGIIDGAGYVQFIYYNIDTTIELGVLNNVRVQNRADGTGDRVFALNANAVINGYLTVDSAHASYTMEFDSSDYTLSVTGISTLGNRGIMTQGTGAWSFGSYDQSGVDSVFNQDATVTISGDFTVSDGIFNAFGDMIVPGDWDTATGDYANDDNVVYLTGASKTLAMNAADSFFNVTIAAGANYTMDDDTMVDRRATITGILYGAGDFKEPLPEFTSEGWPHACPLTLYEYTPTQTYWDTLDLVDPPYWLHLIDGVVTGVPNDNDTGLYEITLTLTWNDMVTYQNYTLIVCPELLSGADKTMLGVVLSIVLGFGLLVIGMTYKIPPLIVFSGLIWLISAVTVYKDISVEWAIIGIGLGVIVLASGGLQLVDEG